MVSLTLNLKLMSDGDKLKIYLAAPHDEHCGNLVAIGWLCEQVAVGHLPCLGYPEYSL